MHRILHDWPDAKCQEILAHLKSAMAKGYSKLLINENMIFDKGATLMEISLDLLYDVVVRCARTYGTELEDAARGCRLQDYEDLDD